MRKLELFANYIFYGLYIIGKHDGIGFSVKCMFRYIINPFFRRFVPRRYWIWSVTHENVHNIIFDRINFSYAKKLLLPLFIAQLSMVPQVIVGVLSHIVGEILETVYAMMFYFPMIVLSGYLQNYLTDKNDKYKPYFIEFQKQSRAWHWKCVAITILFSIESLLWFVLSWFVMDYLYKLK